MAIPVLEFLLFFAYYIAPSMTNHFFLGESKAYSIFHKLTLVIIAIGMIANFSAVAFVWPLFCVYGLFLFLLKEREALKSNPLPLVPFVFSLISAVWFVAATNDLHLLGYDVVWSYYAALHGSILGWLFLGLLAYISNQPKSSVIYAWACAGGLLLFLCVAFGIYRVPVLKTIGVIGFSILVPGSIFQYVRELKGRSKLSRALSIVSLIGILVSMALALWNQFGTISPSVILGIPTMIVAHGMLNALIVVPFFYLALRAEGIPS